MSSIGVVRVCECRWVLGWRVFVHIFILYDRIFSCATFTVVSVSCTDALSNSNRETLFRIISLFFSFFLRSFRFVVSFMLLRRWNLLVISSLCSELTARTFVHFLRAGALHFAWKHFQIFRVKIWNYEKCIRGLVWPHRKLPFHFAKNIERRRRKSKAEMLIITFSIWHRKGYCVCIEWSRVSVCVWILSLSPIPFLSFLRCSAKRNCSKWALREKDKIQTTKLSRVWWTGARGR